MTYRIAIGGIIHETHTFAPERTDLDSFARQGVYTDDALIQHFTGSPTAIGGTLEGLSRAAYTALPLLYAAAMPAGIVTRAAYTTLVEDLLTRLANAGHIDGVLLMLHGAMVAEEQDDCEGEILERARAIVGPTTPLIATLDMHGNVSPAMVDATDALVAFDTNPHLDTFERGLEAAAILVRMLEDGLRPVQALQHPPLLLSALTTWTQQLPLRAVHARAQTWERDPRVVAISVMGGFAYADTPHSGMSVIVTTDGDRALAHTIAGDLATCAMDERQAAAYYGVAVDAAIQQALDVEAGPVILADIGDNIGGGSPGDGTILLHALIAAQAQGAVIVLADPEAVDAATRAGIGATVELLVGGKADHMHGDPVALTGTVERLTDGNFTTAGTDHFAQIYGRTVAMGRCAVVVSDGVRLLLTERKTPPGDLMQLRSQGIIPEEQRIIVVKSAVAFRGAYEPIAKAIIEVDTPGLCTADLRRFTYRKLPRPIFPLDTHLNDT